jgi:hypothetical protein
MPALISGGRLWHPIGRWQLVAAQFLSLRRALLSANSQPRARRDFVFSWGEIVARVHVGRSHAPGWPVGNSLAEVLLFSSG